MIKVLLFLLLLSVCTRVFSQQGCTDPKAQNYDASATINNGSCTYPATSVSLTNGVALPTTTLDESSGLIYTNGELWTHNDSGNPPAIYQVNESTGAIIKTVTI